MDSNNIKQLGSYSERWRFKNPEFSTARMAIAEGEKIRWNEEVDDAFPQLQPNSTKFRDVEFRHVTRDWKLVGRYRWKQVEAMPVLEAKANLYAVRHAMRRVSGHRKRHLVLTDSMTAALAIGKGRSASWKMRTVVQKISAILLATGSSLQCRWIPSEWNPADGPSRGDSKASIPRPVDFDGALQRSAVPVAGEEDMQDSHKAAESCRESGSAFANNAIDLGHRDGEDKLIDQEGKEEYKAENKSYGKKRRRHAPSSGIECQACDSTKIPRTLVQPAGLVQKESEENEDSRGVRCMPREVSGGALSRRRGSQRGKLCGGCSQLPSARPPGSSESTSDSSVTQGVADSMPPSVSNAHSLRGHLPFSSGGFVEGEDRDLPGSIAELLLLPSAHRVRENQSLRHCGPGGERRRSISLVECLASPSGDGSSIKDSTVGRGTSVGPPLSTVPGRGNGETPQPKKKTKRRKSIQGDISRSEPVHEHSLEATAVDPPARSSPRSTSTWRSFPRHSKQTSDLTGGPSSWKVDGIEKREKLREGQPSCTTVRKPKQKHTEKMPRRKKVHRPGYPQPAMKPGLVLHFGVFLEIFCGTGRLGHSIYNKCGWPVLLWDISYGENYDLTQTLNQQKILSWLISGVIRAGHLGTPCNSFSRARDQPGGPPQLRSDLMPLGLPNLRPGDATKVKIGNILLRFSVKMLRKAKDLFIAFTLENPARSRLWICPPMRSFLRLRGVQEAVVEFCAFGTRWRKSTKFVGVHVSFDSLSACRCLGAKRGLCKFTGKPHIALSGQTASGEWWTRIAEPYPRRLCQKLATIFLTLKCNSWPRILQNMLEFRLDGVP